MCERAMKALERLLVGGRLDLRSGAMPGEVGQYRALSVV
jgi:hypothetical protein